MNVTFNPNLNFKSDTNLIAQAARKMQQEQNQTVVMPQQEEPEVRYPDSWTRKDTFEKENTERIENINNKMSELQKAFEEGKSIETILKGKHWEKEYNPADNTVHAKIPNSYDGNEYTIYPDGKVIITNGWGRNEVEREANDELAQYVQQMKSAHEKTQEPKVEPKSNEYTSKVYTQAELDEKANVFAQRLNSRQWKKEYLPENDIIMVRHKHVKDGLEYMIKNDGTILETGLRNKAVVIVEPNSQSAKVFAKYKSKLDPNAPKTSIWMKTKEISADIWKFFAVASTMSVAAAKGLWQGALASAAVLATAVVVKGATAVIKNEKTISDIAKAPLKTAGGAGKVIALATGAIVLAGHLIAGKLEANQKSAVIEHKVDVPHVD